MTARLKILAVDDEPVILDSARRFLDPTEWQVLTAPDGETALRLLAAESPDIVISDLVLPGISGMRLLESALDHDPALLVIITTGYSTVENAVAALKHGAFDFLPKPFTYEELLSCAARARRAVELRLGLRARGSGSGRRGDFRLGLQTWARPERDGTALVGITGLEIQTLEAIDRIELPEIGAELRQGGPLVSLFSTDGLTHTLWSPLGGRVLAANPRLRADPSSLREDPEGDGFIARIRPEDLEGELPNLIGS